MENHLVASAAEFLVCEWAFDSLVIPILIIAFFHGNRNLIWPVSIASKNALGAYPRATHISTWNTYTGA